MASRFKYTATEIAAAIMLALVTALLVVAIYIGRQPAKSTGISIEKIEAKADSIAASVTSARSIKDTSKTRQSKSKQKQTPREPIKRNYLEETVND